MRSQGTLEFYRGTKRLRLAIDTDTGGRAQFILEHVELRGQAEHRSAAALTSFEIALAEHVTEGLRTYYAAGKG